MECRSCKTLTKILEKRFSFVKLLHKTSRRKQNFCGLELGKDLFFNKITKNTIKEKIAKLDIIKLNTFTLF